MSDKKERVTEAVGIVSAIVGLIRLIVDLFKPKKDCGCDKDCAGHQPRKND
jgi:formate-dependent nitrite reductase membrane component NrfD